MDSGRLDDSVNGLNSIKKSYPFPENIKVYTRRNKKSLKAKDSAAVTGGAAQNTASAVPATSTATTEAPSPSVAPSASAEVPNPTPTSSSAEFALPATSPAATPSPAEATTAHGDAVLKSVEVSLGLADHVNSSSERLQEQSPDREKTVESGEDITQLDDTLNQNCGQEGSGGEAAKPESLNEVSLEVAGQSTGLSDANGLPPERENGPQNLGDPMQVDGANELPNGGEQPPSKLPGGSESLGDREATPIPPPLHGGSALVNDNGVVKPLVITRANDKVKFNLSEVTEKLEVVGIRKKLEVELDRIRSIAKELESRDLQLASYNADVSVRNSISNNDYVSVSADFTAYQSQPPYTMNGVADRTEFVRGNMEVDPVGHREIRPIGLARVNSDIGAARRVEPRQYSRQLTVSVMENNHRVGEFVEKEKRTPKANQYYRNSEFLLGKDRLPPESNKRLKTSNGRKHGTDNMHALGYGFGFDKNRNQVFRSCSNLLQRLMKHKHGWVFNEPVNAKALGLHDYHDIIKHPMDLGTIKNRLAQNYYKSPREFAEDVRLVFRNAMTYNPKGQDVHIMAEELSGIFEERWAVMESEYNHYWKYQMYQDAGLPTPTSRKAPPQPRFAHTALPAAAPAPAPAHVFVPTPVAAPIHASLASQMRNLDRSDSISTPVAADPKIHRQYVARTPVPKKPKAKDPNKRDMTYDEKQKLSSNLQSLPSEKLDAIVQIIKRRNTALSQHNDEIEVDIDKVDAETLWELDRFVTNYKKSLSKNKRKAELALQARAGANQTAPLVHPTAVAMNVQTEGGTVGRSSSLPIAVQGEQGNASRSSSSSSSSSDSGSSSSDSDSDSSSADGSDAGHSPRT